MTASSISRIDRKGPPAPERKITADMPLEDQISTLEAMIRNPPTNSRVIYYSPELATHILTNLVGNNRPFKPASIKRYMADMAADKWGLTGDTIKFGSDRLLKDGYNRQMAASKSVGFTSHTVFGVDPTLFARMDIGKNRNGPDVFAIELIDYPGHTAAMVRWHGILNGVDPKDRGRFFTNEELLTAYRSLNPDKVKDAIKMAIAIKRSAQHPVGPLAALYYDFAEINSGKARSFYTEWASGLAGKPRAPSRYLQAELVSLGRETSGRIHENVRNAFIINAWNAHYAGRSATKKDFAWKTIDPFPTIAGK